MCVLLTLLHCGCRNHAAARRPRPGNRRHERPSARQSKQPDQNAALLVRQSATASRPRLSAVSITSALRELPTMPAANMQCTLGRATGMPVLPGL